MVSPMAPAPDLALLDLVVDLVALLRTATTDRMMTDENSSGIVEQKSIVQVGARPAQASEF